MCVFMMMKPSKAGTVARARNTCMHNKTRVNKDPNSVKVNESSVE